jgi:hypothetical protein
MPLLLKIILAILALQLILLIIFWKKGRKIILISMLLVAGVGAWQAVKEYNRKNADLSKIKADVKISAINLINEYEANDSLANRKYLGKVIELTGNVRKLEDDGSGNYTIVLGEQGSLSSVRCTMDTMYRNDAAAVPEGSSVTVRGLCSGFKKNELLGENLGSDVELNRSVVIKNEK